MAEQRSLLSGKLGDDGLGSSDESCKHGACNLVLIRRECLHDEQSITVQTPVRDLDVEINCSYVARYNHMRQC